MYLQGIDSNEIIETIRRRPVPMLPASAGLRYRVVGRQRNVPSPASSTLSLVADSGGVVQVLQAGGRRERLRRLQVLTCRW